MLLIDDLLLLPAKGFIGLIKKIHSLALEELEDTPEKLKRALLDLQLLLEKGQINEKQYLKREKDILERLNALQKKKQSKVD